MGLCVNCIYHKNSSELEKKFYVRFPSDYEHKIQIKHLCTHPENTTVNFVTGEKSFDSCYKWNGYNECLFFDDGTEKEPANPDPSEPITPIAPEPTEPTKSEGSGD